MLDSKPNLRNVTLVAVDTSDKAVLTARAIEKCEQQCDFGAIKFFTDKSDFKHVVKIDPFKGLEGYSQFITRRLHEYTNTTHVLVVQWDGYILNPGAWSATFLNYDYIGPPWQKWKVVGNGGFSLRSKKLLEATAKISPTELAHPEDAWICNKHRVELQNLFRVQFAPYEVAQRFGFEGRSYDGVEWKGVPTAYNEQFGFHSYLTVLPDEIDKPLIFHHSGDAGDVIYSLPVVQALGGGVMFFSVDNRYPHPKPTRWSQNGGSPGWVSNLAPLLEAQPYVWRALYTHGLPFSTDIDFNVFRQSYRTPNPDNWESLFRLQQKPFGLTLPEDKPWLTVNNPRPIEGKPIVVNRTARFQNDAFPWPRLVKEHGKQMQFVGDKTEHGYFCQKFGFVEYTETANLLQVAELIAGAKVFIGNQSAPLAIALGLGQNSIIEVWVGNANCNLHRPNVIHRTDNSIEIPKSWL